MSLSSGDTVRLCMSARSPSNIIEISKSSGDAGRFLYFLYRVSITCPVIMINIQDRVLITIIASRNIRISIPAHILLYVEQQRIVYSSFEK